MRIIFDARSLKLYPVAQPGFHGGTEAYLRIVAHGLAEHGHDVHIIAPDLRRAEQRGPSEWWWSPEAFPTDTDALVLFHNMEGVTTARFNAPILICATNGIDPWCGPQHELIPMVDGWPVFSETHKKMLTSARPIDPAKCFVTGLGVRLEDYGLPLQSAVSGRLLYANDPARGLWHVLDIFDQLKPLVPDASLHIAYDFDRQFEVHRWTATAMAELLWDCKRRIEHSPGIVNLGALSRADLIREQLECQVHAMPSDPPNAGSQIHGITQMECAAAGAALVLSDTEAFPEIFGNAATILPLPGTFLPEHSRRYDAQDWADVIAELMQDPEKWANASIDVRNLAEQHTWQHVVKKWEAMLERLALRDLAEAAVAVGSD